MEPKILEYPSLKFILCHSEDDTSEETVGGGDGVDEIFKSKDIADKTGDGFEEISEGASDEVVEGKADSKIDKAKDSSDAEVLCAPVFFDTIYGGGFIV